MRTGQVIAVRTVDRGRIEFDLGADAPVDSRRTLASRRGVALVVVVALIMCAVMFVGLPTLLDPIPYPPVFGTGLF